MKSNQELVGQKFGRLTVLEWAGKDKKRNVLWKCLCECGKGKIIRGSTLLHRKNLSCGCLASEIHSKQAFKMHDVCRTHGMTGTPTWVSWSNMMVRCFNKNRQTYKDYGGRGILPCEFIKATPANVIALIGERPCLELQIDRINNNSGYTCGQCPDCIKNGWPLNIRWTDRKTQARNKRNSRFLTYQGLTMTRMQWAEKLNKTFGWVRYNIG